MRAPHRTQCWLCGAKLPPLEDPTAAAPPREAPDALAPPPMETHPRGASFSIATLLLATTVVAICAALVAEAPGIGITMCILLAPVLVRTAMVVRRREAAGKRVSAGEKIGLILTSFVVINVIVAVVGFAAIGTFCAVCLGTVGALDEASMVVAGISALVITVALLVVMVRWVRSRYRRDIS
ncbi:MAG TPA: hypothetical protein VF175_18315 [Lacipirellula sp.]